MSWSGGWSTVKVTAPIDLIARHGPSVGINILAATTRVDDARLEQWVGLFGSRLVFQTPDEASSVRLLGEGGAEDLDAIGARSRHGRESAVSSRGPRRERTPPALRGHRPCGDAPRGRTELSEIGGSVCPR